MPKLHRRSLEVKYMPIERLKTDKDRITDKFFLELYAKFLSGRSTAWLTRFDEKKITSGFYTFGEGEILYTQERPEHAEALITHIRSGARPAVHLYQHPRLKDRNSALCPDDGNILQAYRTIGIRHIPAILFSTSENLLDESYIKLRCRGGTVKFDGFKGKSIDRFPCILKEHTDERDLDVLIDRTKCLGREVKLFHQDRTDSTHYHYSLYSTLKRHARTLEAMKLLFTADRAEHAIVLTRLLYEAFLNFYVDWLSPDHIGKYLQYIAYYNRSRYSKNFTDDQKNPLPRPDTIMGSFSHFLENVAQKAELSPLGIHFHRLIYPPLSFIAHQDYGVLEDSISDFEDHTDVKPSDRIEKAIAWSDIITTALLMRAANDLGTTY